ncbi:acyl-CoA dehydrogenase [Clostridium botulinum A2B3 87]|uniref:acyl-CoA dehydrogenase family protein n=1 Tax=Clostridium botulinum TaxID=1491 RepID=UPI0004A572C6|nr:acyl-CoA dehydrogenase family protein [Clostridium botulinum]KEI98776.1 acyl-CoA dehydrogenase [Clostridium botulinum A2B3 87]MBN3346606.1 acyl-CoA dehydrogenase [Clostridium botulinum]
MNSKCLAESNKLSGKFDKFVEKEIYPYAEQNDRTEILSPEVIKAFAQNGYLGSMIPKEYNGMGLNYYGIGLLNESVGKVCSSSRGLLTVHGMVALAILKWGNDEQKQKWLPKLASGEVIGAFGLTEPSAGSDSNSIETEAVKQGDIYVLSGTKKWTTMGQIADLFLIFAKVEGKATAFLVEKDTPGFSVAPINGLIGARASMIAELHLDQCVVSEENIIGTIGFGLSHVALSSLDYGRYTIAWGCIGAAETCLNLSIKYAKKRKQFGSALRKNQMIQKMVAKMTVEIEAAKLLCTKAGILKDEGDPDYIIQIWMAKYYGSKTLTKVAGDSVQIHGANGCINKNPVERIYRDAKINEIVEGSSEIHEILISNNAFLTYC